MSGDFVARLQVSESGFAFDPQTGSTFTLNRSARAVVELLRVGKTPDEILETLRRDFDVDGADARRDLEDFLMALKEHAAL